MAHEFMVTSSTTHESKQFEQATQPIEQIQDGCTSPQPRSESNSQCQLQPRPPLERTRTLSFSEPIRPSRPKDQSWRITTSYSSHTEIDKPENKGSDPIRGRKTRSPSPYPKPQEPPLDDEDDTSDGDWEPRNFFSTLASRFRNG